MKPVPSLVKVEIAGYIVGLDGRADPNPYESGPLADAWFSGLLRGRARRLREQEQGRAEVPGALVVVRPGWFEGERREAIAQVVGSDGRRYALRRWLPEPRRWTPIRLYPAFAIVRLATGADLLGVELGHVADQLSLEVV